MQVLLILHTPDLFVNLILYRISCDFILARLKLYLPLGSNVQCADPVKQPIFPLSFVLVRRRVEFDSNAIGTVVLEVALVSSILECLFSVAMASVFDELALVLSATCPSVGSLSIKISIDEFAFI